MDIGILKYRRSVSAILAVAIGLCARADTPYPIGKTTQDANRRLVEATAEGAYWKGQRLAVCTVEAMSGIRRTPDLFPADGDFSKPLRFIAARGEYEPGSFLLFAFDDLDGVQVTAGDLVGKSGARIPASAIDLTVVKVWYQSGTAWGGFHGDHLRRVPVPELMVKDEKLIEVDHARKENFVRADFFGGKPEYRWISFMGAVCDYGYFGVKNSWLHDAKSLRPVSLQKNAFKQFFATLHVPPRATPGLYRGTISVAIDGKPSVKIPVEARVLPFELPRPATLRDLDREFYASVYMGHMDMTENPAIAKNLAAHNVLHPLLPGVETEEAADALAKTLTENGLATNTLFSVLPSAGISTSYPPDKDDKDYKKHLSRIGEASNAMARLRARFGEGVKAYAYGIDEAGAKTVRAQRATWQAFHSLGARIITTTRFHPYLLFGLDCALPPMQPSPIRKKNADAFHDANPDGLIGWYADPHSGPENPDWARRLYGFITWRNNYDMFCQYILFRDDWTEFYIPNEPFLRGLMLCYTQDGALIDTLAWEGVREGVDDIRYATLLRQMARRAIDTSEDMDTVYLGRAAMTWIAQVDFERSSLRALRHEMINRILDLRTRLEKEGK